ncbi:hypothetical protein [Streptomyces canus]|uniref:hypothetical protein n=1 Tax=Streptomyces canus TaxID=58343 RepID=UPI002DDA8C20|nr:hypothetical protein [Streptomyces canus]WSD92729.1 hypothetical protein OG925_51705 [Streptomyces canus]
MARYPRVHCPVCDDVVAGVPTRRIGMLSVHDHKRTARALVLCPGSMAHVPAADALAVQEELPEDPVTAAAVETPTLF